MIEGFLAFCWMFFAKVLIIAFHVSRRAFFGENSLLENILFFKIIWNLRGKFLVFRQKFFDGVVKTAFHVSIGTFCGKISLAKSSFFLTFGHWLKNFLPVVKIHRQGCQEWLLRVRKNSFRKDSTEIFFRNSFWTISKKFSAFCQKFIGRVKTAWRYTSLVVIIKSLTFPCNRLQSLQLKETIKAGVPFVQLQQHYAYSSFPETHNKSKAQKLLVIFENIAKKLIIFQTQIIGYKIFPERNELKPPPQKHAVQNQNQFTETILYRIYPDTLDTLRYLIHVHLLLITHQTQFPFIMFFKSQHVFRLNFQQKSLNLVLDNIFFSTN